MFSEKSDLGWDSTIEDSYDGEKRMYIFNVSGKLYFSSTADIVIDVEAEGLYSTGTRIFKVYRESDKKKERPMILKDYWPAEVYDTEVNIRSRILTEITDSNEHELVKNALLTPDTFENVKVEGREDHTEEVILRGRSPTGIYKFEAPQDKVGRRKNSEKYLCTGVPFADNEESQTESKENAPRGSSPICHRKHCRIVYREDAKPYHKLENIKDMILVLEQSIKGRFYSKSKLFII